MINKETQTTLTRKLAAQPISDAMCVYKIEVTQTINQEKTVKIHEGVADLSRVNDWNGLEEKLDNGYVLAYSFAVDKYKKYGMCGDFYRKENWGYADWDNCINNKPFTAITSVTQGNPFGYEFMKLSGYDNSLTLLDGTVIAKPIVFGYMNGSVDNSNYDLERLAELLYNRSDVIFFKNDKIIEGPLKESDCQGLIESIPYYNAGDGRDENISFMVILSQEKYTTMMQDLGEDNHSFAQYQYIAKHDLAGIEGARLNPEPVIETKKSKFRR